MVELNSGWKRYLQRRLSLEKEGDFLPPGNPSQGGDKKLQDSRRVGQEVSGAPKSAGF